MGINQNPGTSSPSSAMLDRTPPSPADKVFSKPTDPGDDTRSLLGDDEANEEGGNASLQSAGNKLMLSQAMFMQAVNIREAVAPNSIPPEFVQWIAQQQEEVPMMAEQMAGGGNPGSLLSAIGQQGAGPSSGTPVMSAANRPMGGGMMAAGEGGGGGGMGGGSGSGSGLANLRRRPAPPDNGY